MRYDRIWLIGFSGTGKSRVARPLAAALDWEAVDLDDLVEQRADERVPAIFRRGGEGAFRVLEAQVLDETARRKHVVVATGGGAVLSATNRTLMRRRGFIACLEARPETILRRLRESDADVSERPLLEGDDPLARIIELKSKRQHFYDECDLSVPTDDLSPDEVTHRVLTAFRERQATARGRA